MKLPDLWDECYTPEHRRIGKPEEFRATFCDKCVNPGCRNSAAAGTKWSRRMQSQEEHLLTNPRFADPNDPSFSNIRGVDWHNAIREALAIEVSTRKGDWSVATESEIGQAAAELVGIVPPSFAAPTPEPEPEPEPEPDPEPEPPKPPTAKEVIILMRDAASVEELEACLPPGESRKTVLKVFGSLKQKLMVEEEPPKEDPVPEPPEESGPAIEGQWRVQGDSKTKDGKHKIYEVTLYEDGNWGCTCPAQTVCKHIESIARRLSNAPAEQEVKEHVPSRPEFVRTPPPQFKPTRNTATPSEGIMVGGGPPPEPEDPWAPKKKINPKDRVIGVGGTVRFGSKDRGD